MFTDQRDKLLPSAGLAEAMWRAVRRAAWESRFGIRPPTAAHVWDGIGDSLLDYHPHIQAEPSDEGGIRLVSTFDPEEGRRRLEADLTSITRFREADPEGAAEIADELDQYATDLKVLYEAGCAHAGDPQRHKYDWADYDKMRTYGLSA